MPSLPQLRDSHTVALLRVTSEVGEKTARKMYLEVPWEVCGRLPDLTDYCDAGSVLPWNRAQVDVWPRSLSPFSPASRRPGKQTKESLAGTSGAWIHVLLTGSCFGHFPQLSVWPVPTEDDRKPRPLGSRYLYICSTCILSPSNGLVHDAPAHVESLAFIMGYLGRLEWEKAIRRIL